MKEKSSPKYKICPNCSFFCRIEEQDNYCLLCGSALITKCPGCGQAIDYPYARYCKYCGVELPGRDQKQSKLKKF